MDMPGNLSVIETDDEEQGWATQRYYCFLSDAHLSHLPTHVIAFFLASR